MNPKILNLDISKEQEFIGHAEAKLNREDLKVEVQYTEKNF